MSSSDAVPSVAGAAGSGPAPRRGTLRRLLYTHNPWYAVSAALVFWGLRSSFDVQAGTLPVGLLFGCLAAYTLLLAGTAWCLLRLGGSIWEDVRTLLLLVLLLLLAISVTLDDALARWTTAGIWFNLAGTCLAALTSEGLLRGLRIRLPALWRGPYHALVALFFLYPVLLTGMLQHPNSAAMQWGLFLFSPCVALVLLTLAPAVRRGADYVRNNGTPWEWPWFPWTVFGVLVGCAALRSYYLCLSLHFVVGTGSIFDLYFLSPLVLALGVLALERGLVRQSPAVQRAAFAFPALAVVLAGTPWFAGSVHERFLTLFQATVRATPLVAALSAAIVFAAWAAARRAHGGVVALSLGLVAFAFIDPGTRDLSEISGIRHVLPLAAATAVQTAWAVARGHSVRWFLASLLAVATASIYGRDTWLLFYGAVVPSHVLLACGLTIAALCDDAFARVLRTACGSFLIAAALVAILAEPPYVPDVSSGALHAYVLGTVIAAWVYGRLMRARYFAVVVAFNAFAWLVWSSAQAYAWLRPQMAGLDAVALGLAFFAAAAVISLAKAGRLREVFRQLLRATGAWLDFSRNSSHS